MNCFTLDHPFFILLVLASAVVVLIYASAKIALKNGTYEKYPLLMLIGMEPVLLIPVLMVAVGFLKFFRNLC